MATDPKRSAHPSKVATDEWTPPSPKRCRAPRLDRTPWGVQCRAKSKRSGQRCRKSAIYGGFVCMRHGGAAPQVRQAAQERLYALLPKAFQVLEECLDAKDKRVALRAVTIVHKRTGLTVPAQRKSRARGQDPLTVPEQKVLDAVAELESAA